MPNSNHKGEDHMDDLGIPEFLRRKKGEVPEAAPVAPPVAVVPTVPDEPVPEVSEPSIIEKIQRGKRENAGELIAEINEHYDAFILNGSEFNAYDFFRTREVKPAIAKIVMERYQPELLELLESYKDPELKAGYKNINIKETIKFLEGIISDADRWMDNQKGIKGRKTRTVKINPGKKIKSLKFLKENPELKLVSIAPERIIGAQELWTYNIRTKHLTHYVAGGRSGFMVKGTTLQYFDVDNSISKVLRKPEVILADVLAKKKKIFDNLTTRVIVPTGRINEHTILLRVG